MGNDLHGIGERPAGGEDGRIAGPDEHGRGQLRRAAGLHASRLKLDLAPAIAAQWDFDRGFRPVQDHSERPGGGQVRRAAQDKPLNELAGELELSQRRGVLFQFELEFGRAVLPNVSPIHLVGLAAKEKVMAEVEAVQRAVQRAVLQVEGLVPRFPRAQQQVAALGRAQPAGADVHGSVAALDLAGDVFNETQLPFAALQRDSCGPEGAARQNNRGPVAQPVAPPVETQIGQQGADARCGLEFQVDVRKGLDGERPG